MEDFPAAPYDTTSKVITGFVVLLTGFFVVLSFTGRLPPYAMALMPVILIVTWGFSIRGYTVEPGILVVNRPFLGKTIRLEGDLVAEHDPAWGKGAVKVAGNGGLFGYYGTFRSVRLGQFSAYATTLKNGVVIRAGGKTFVVTPEEPGMFLTRLTESVC